MDIDLEASVEFIRTGYEPEDWIAVFLKSYATGRVAQRVGPVSLVMSTRFREWLRRENDGLANVYVSVNAVRPGQLTRTRRAIRDIRHIFAEADRIVVIEETAEIHLEKPGPSGPQPAIVGATTWTFEVVPQTNLQTFKATIRSENAWLPVATVSTTAIIPGNTPPAQISTQGDYDSPRGCRGTFGSFGTAAVARIDADFTGVDCDPVTFTGRVTLANLASLPFCASTPAPASGRFRPMQ